MKRLFILPVLLLLVAVPVSAHGGVEHNTKDAVVTLYQTPLSPLIHEHVETDFIFAGKDGNRLKNMPVKLTMTDTYFGDESKDKVVLAREFRTDQNGIIEFGYRYAKPDYYDLDLDFTVNGKPQEGGFLLQIRNPYKNWYSLGYGAVLILGITIGLIVANKRWQVRHKPD